LSALPIMSANAKCWYGMMLRLVASLVMVLCFCMTAQASTKETFFLPPDEVSKHQTTIDRVANYLSGLSTIVSDFTQVAPDGSLSSGKFYLKRPGRMRWQYNPPTPILMIANGKEFVYYDYELEQVSYIPLDSALVGFLAQEKIRFDEKVGITSFEEKDGVIRIGLAQRDKPSEGALLLELSDKPLMIRTMVVTDATGQQTSVALSDAKFGVKLEKDLFIFRDPRQNPRGPRNRTVLNQ
jgi:outer membrane lipoprotein-sorting protein